MPMAAPQRNSFSTLSVLMMSLALILGVRVGFAPSAHAASPFAGTYTGKVNGYDATLEVSADGKVTYFNAQFWFFCNGMSTLNTAYWDAPVAVNSAGSSPKNSATNRSPERSTARARPASTTSSFYLGCAGDVSVTLKKAGAPKTPATKRIAGSNRSWGRDRRIEVGLSENGEGRLSSHRHQLP